MILPDVNILLYAHNEASEHFDRANAWFAELMSGDLNACFCRETIHGFLRISTNLRALPRPISLGQAYTIVDGWLSAPNALFLDPTPAHYDLLRRVALEADAKGPLFSDAILATYALSNNATIASSDRDFRLFEGISWFDPLVD